MKRKILFTVLALVLAPLLAWAAAPKTFMANLTGSEEVPSVMTPAMGHVMFKLSPDGNSLHFRLMVRNLQDITMAHIHQGPPGKNGPVVAWLFPATGTPGLKAGKLSGVLAEGDLTSANLVGPLQGKPLSALLQEMQSGQTYVNVHTKQHPEGEIRGEIK